MQKNKTFQKYKPFPILDLPDRQWPSRQIEQHPIWCSVDLRDGNQALVQPMHPAKKMQLFERLVAMGFQEIEVGFPAASQDEFQFLRRLIEEQRIPDNVTIQVLVQAREPLIKRTFQALQGAERAIIHLYNSTSTLQRRVVFGKNRQEIIQIARHGVDWIEQYRAIAPGCQIRLQYSPESFTGTEIDFAEAISREVLTRWQKVTKDPMILNLPATVEMTTPNRYADRIEWFQRRFGESVILSVHTHNDRGSAVAATELALLAGADRVEGTLFGNGERTGNVDLVTLALNLHTQGVDPGLNVADMPEIVTDYETTTGMAVPPRHPYAGELVFTAFSGSHQDAIRKGLAAQNRDQQGIWEVPYLPLDPRDVGRHYESLIRINSQSGKGGATFILEQLGYTPPEALHGGIGRLVQEQTDALGRELDPVEIEACFRSVYQAEAPLRLGDFSLSSPSRWQKEGDRKEGDQKECGERNSASGNIQPQEEKRAGEACRVVARVIRAGEEIPVMGEGVGPVAAFVEGLKTVFALDFQVEGYHQHALGPGRQAEAVSYVRVRGVSGGGRFGIGIARDTTRSALEAVLAAVNRGLYPQARPPQAPPSGHQPSDSPS
ncbi:MAG: 2-isopropylmalate synthase [Magnetococcales bacterium]|nr:2-isopropylmalate synthase [Magnetococcales bacterium]